ncbi:MAG: hypothetical protein ACRDVL_12455 [Acidimicrobiia bacterium]
MRLRKWGYVVIAAAMVVVIALIAYDQLFVDFGDDSSYLLGKATPAVVWVLTLATPFALGDFFAWLRRTQHGRPAFWWATVGVAAAFLIGWFAARGRSLVWLVEGDIEVTFNDDEFLEVVVGLWSACLTALLIRLSLRPRQVGYTTARHEALSG